MESCLPPEETQEQLPGGPRPIPGVPEQWLPQVMKEAEMSFLKSEMLKCRTNNGFRHKCHDVSMKIQGL